MHFRCTCRCHLHTNDGGKTHFAMRNCYLPCGSFVHFLCNNIKLCLRGALNLSHDFTHWRSKQASAAYLRSRTSQLYVVHLRRAETWVVRARKRFCSCASQGARARMHVCKGHPRKGLHQSCKSCAHFHLMHKDRLLMIHSWYIFLHCLIKSQGIRTFPKIKLWC